MSSREFKNNTKVSYCKICGAKLPLMWKSHTYCKDHFKDRGVKRAYRAIKH